MTQDATPITIEKPGQLVGAPEHALLGFNHACIECEYNLLGIEIGGRCPECSMLVQRSLSRRLLQNAPESTIRTLRSGARCVTLAALLPLPVLGIGLISAMVVPLDLLQILIHGVHLLIWLLFAFGWFRLTEPLSGFDLVPETDKVRRNCRVASVVFSVGWFAMTLVTVSATLGASFWASLLLPLLLLVLWMVQLRHGTSRVRQIALALPSKALARYSRAVYLVLLSNVFLAIGSVVIQGVLILSYMGVAGTGVPGTVFSIVSGLAAILFGLTALAGYAMYVGLYRRLWVGLNKLLRSQQAPKQRTEH